MNIMILSWYNNNITVFGENEELDLTGIDSYIMIPDTMMLLLNYEYDNNKGSKLYLVRMRSLI